jgi:hypothetical protein
MAVSSSDRFAANILEAVLRGGVQGGDEDGAGDAGSEAPVDSGSDDFSEGSDEKPKGRGPVRLIRADGAEVKAQPKVNPGKAAVKPTQPQAKPSLDDQVAKATQEAVDPWADIDSMLADPEEETPDAEDNLEEDPELKGKPGAQKRIKALLERTKAAETQVQQFNQHAQQVQAQAQRNYQLATQYQRQNQQLREMVAGFEARMDSFEKYGPKPVKGEEDPLQEFEGGLLQKIDSRFKPELERRDKEIAALKQERIQERRNQEQAQRRAQFRQQGDKVAKALLAEVHPEFHNEKLEGLLYGISTSLALSHKLGSIEEGGEMARGLLKQFVRGYIKQLQSRSKNPENKKVSQTVQGKQRVSGNQRKVLSNTEAKKTGLGGDSLSAAMSRDGLQRAR